MEQPATNPAANKVKLALIPVLGLVLVYLVFGSGSSESPAVPTAPPPSTGQPSAPDRPDLAVQNVTANAEQRTVDWPQRSLQDILRHDPFRIRQAVDPAVASEMRGSDEQNAPPEQVSEASLLVGRFAGKVPELVLESRHGTSAVIDGQTLREGDVLDGVARVVSIRPEGIVFELVGTE